MRQETIYNALKTVGHHALDMVLPAQCPVTRLPVEEPGMIDASLWKELDFITAPYCTSCSVPFEIAEHDDKDHICASCLENPPPYNKARAPLVYNEAAKDLILAFKHADKTQLVRSFLPWMLQSGEDVLALSDVIIPVPLHYWRLFKRRYNQAALLADALGKATQKPVFKNSLQRQIATSSQGKMGPKDRFENVKNAFGINPKTVNHIVGKSVLLVDDVYTTGATIKACSQVLLDAGVSEVNVLCIARNQKPDPLIF